MAWKRPTEFGARVRAARGFANLTQSQLAARVADCADHSMSAATIKRLEHDDPSVKGTVGEWAAWVSEATGVPVDFMLNGFAEGEASNG